MSSRRRRRKLNPRFVLLCAALTLLALDLAILAVRHFSKPSGLPGEGVDLPDYVTRDLLKVNEWSRPGDPLEKIDGVVIHYVGNPGTTAEANRNYFQSLSKGKEQIYASSHFIVGLEGEVVQCVPLTEIAYASNARNEDTVSIEVCHPDETGEFSPATYNRAVDLTAWLCAAFDIDPEKDVIRHYDVSGKRCPLYYVEHEDAWEAFREDVERAAEALKAAEKKG